MVNPCPPVASVQVPEICPQRTTVRYLRILLTWSSLPLLSSFCSMLETILQDARRAPITFLYATESRLRSSTLSSDS